MIYKRSEFLIILRVIALVIFISATVISYYETDLIITPIMLALLGVITTIELIWHLRGLQRNVTQFLLSIKHHDFSRHYKNQTKFKELNEAYELITQSFEKIQTEKQADYRLLQTVSEHLQIGLVCYKTNGEIMFANSMLKELLRLQSLAKIESLIPTAKSLYDYLINENPVTNVLVEAHKNQKLLLKTESFSLQGKKYKLASLYDIKSALDTNELESYQKLMKVMTHEIMNSATPILSLIQVINKKLIDDGKIVTLSEKDQGNIAISLNAIETQTAGILRFVEAYRKINKEISPSYEKTNVESLLDPIITLIIDQSETSFTLTNEVHKDFFLDVGLISQTLINLLKNAKEAILENIDPQIHIIVKEMDRQLYLTVEDNGLGIPANKVNDLFIPFFSTKPEGSGIGLALSRKIINAPGGSLTYQRTDAGFTQFVVALPENVFGDQARKL